MDDFRLKYGKTNEELRAQLERERKTGFKAAFGAAYGGGKSVEQQRLIDERMARGAAVMVAIAGRPVEPGQAIYRNEIVSVDPSTGIIKGNRKQRRALGRKNNG